MQCSFSPVCFVLYVGIGVHFLPYFFSLLQRQFIAHKSECSETLLTCLPCHKMNESLRLSVFLSLCLSLCSLSFPHFLSVVLSFFLSVYHSVLYPSLTFCLSSSISPCVCTDAAVVTSFTVDGVSDQVTVNHSTTQHVVLSCTAVGRPAPGLALLKVGFCPDQFEKVISSGQSCLDLPHV